MTTNSFSYEKNKVIQALRYHFISRPEIKFMIVLVNIFAIGSAALYYFKVIKPFPFLVSSLLWFFLMLVFWYFLPLGIYKKERTFKDSFQANFNEDEFSIENERGRRSWSWPQFSTWTESPHFFHLYFNSRSFFIIPKEAFTGDDAHACRNLLRTKIKP